jgi:WD40 repeat protein
MPNKIFISYRRQDTAASALGIGQYLENAFGRKNLFIDVDMRAGAKFPGTLLRKLQNASPLFGSAGAPWSIAISPDDRWITSGNTDRSIRIWDAKTYSLARSIFGHAKGVSALAFSPDGHEFASGGADHVVKIWASP